jgi:hypothetical protein
MTRKTDLIAMAEKLEAENEPDQYIFYDAGELVFGTYDWVPTWLQFESFINGGAWTSAAEMLAQCGWDYSVFRYGDGKGYDKVWCADNDGTIERRSEAATPALALAAASCRAWAEMCNE